MMVWVLARQSNPLMTIATTLTRKEERIRRGREIEILTKSKHYPAGPKMIQPQIHLNMTVMGKQEWKELKKQNSTVTLSSHEKADGKHKQQDRNMMANPLKESRAGNIEANARRPKKAVILICNRQS